MTCRTARCATLLAATLLVSTTLLGAPAHAAEITLLPGCWGAGGPATVFCDVSVTYGVPVGVETYTTTVQVCTGTCQDVPLTLAHATPGDPVVVCVTWTDGDGSPGWACVDELGGPVEDVLRTIENLPASLDDVVKRDVVDPLLCPVFQALSPGLPGLLDISNEGDLTLSGRPFWDCPPYGNLYPPA